MIKVNVLQSVSHDRYHLHKGQTEVPLPNGIARQLIDAGFVVETSISTDDAEDLVGGKMEAEPKNKAIKTPKAD